MGTEKNETKELLHQAIESLKSSEFLNEFPDQKKEHVEIAINAMRQTLLEAGGTYHEDVNEVYEAARGTTFLVRREDPEKVLLALTEHQDLEINPKPTLGQIYANCAEWRYDIGDRGLKNAFLEGHAELGGLVTVVGFKKGNDIEIAPVESNQELGSSILDHDLVRAAQGYVHPDEIKFVVLRIPAGYLTEDNMSAREKKIISAELAKPQDQRKVIQIFRGFAFNELAEKIKQAQGIKKQAA